jgi:hypothetical protein
MGGSVQLTANRQPLTPSSLQFRYSSRSVRTRIDAHLFADAEILIRRLHDRELFDASFVYACDNWIVHFDQLMRRYRDPSYGVEWVGDVGVCVSGSSGMHGQARAIDLTHIRFGNGRWVELNWSWRPDRGLAQLGLARLTGGQEVAGSNPVAPTFFRNEPFGENVEGLCRCGTRVAARVSCSNGTASGMDSPSGLT